MTHFSARPLIMIVVMALSTVTAGTLAQQPQRPERPQQRHGELERVREAREAQEQARAEAIRRAQQQAQQQARQRAQAAREREQQQQRVNEPERSIVLPQDYPNATSEPVRSGVSMGTYTRMLSDLDPAYRMFAIGQLVQFNGGAFASGEALTGTIARLIEISASQDADPGVRVFALYRLSDLDMERAVELAREALEELPRDSDSWRFTLALLACAEPDEFTPMVRDTLVEIEASSSGRNALWGVSIVNAPFDEFVSMAQTIAMEQIARDAALDRLLFSRQPRMHADQPSLVGTLWFMGRGYAHATSDGDVAEGMAAQIAEAYGNVVRVSFEHALRDDRGRAFLLERYLDVPSGDEHSWPFGASTLPEEAVAQAKSFATHRSDRSGSTAFTILDAVENAFDQIMTDASDQESQLLDAMRSALLDRDSWAIVRPSVPTRANALVNLSQGWSSGLLPTEESRSRLRELLKGAHESPTAAPWVLVPGCVVDTNR